MNLTTRRRLSRLEKRVPSFVAERKRRESELMASLHQAVLYHATKLATLILHGDPKIDEPLAIAWERALDYLGLSGTHLVLSGTPQELLYYRLRAALEDLPGDTEIDKLAHIFRSAPSWLLDFCTGWLDCCLLGIEVPKSSEPAPEFGRDGLREANDSWPDLPKGTIGAGQPIPKSNPMRVLSPEEAIDLSRLLESGEENWSRRDRHRYSEIMAKVDWAPLLAGYTSSLDEGVTDEK
jgi:hypothetical protein